MAAAGDEGMVVSLRMLRPGGEGELEFILESGKYRRVDAVFTSVDAVQRILIPFYAKDKKDKELSDAVQAQQRDGVCFVLHVRSCTWMVPEINWDAASPIRL